MVAVLVVKPACPHLAVLMPCGVEHRLPQRLTRQPCTKPLLYPSSEVHRFVINIVVTNQGTAAGLKEKLPWKHWKVQAPAHTEQAGYIGHWRTMRHAL